MAARVSSRFSVNRADVQKSLRNALIFLAPALLVLLADVVQALPEWVRGPWLVLALWGVNWVTDLVRKFLAGR